MITFEKFNVNANYYSKTSRTTGKNVWNQNEMQQLFMALIEPCNLSKEQLANLECFVVSNNATIDMEPSKNNSAQEFSEIVKAKEEVVQRTL